MELAGRTAAIAERLGKACHIMWFVDCADQNGSQFNIPWYRNEAHDAERNLDRSSYQLLNYQSWFISRVTRLGKLDRKSANAWVVFEAKVIEQRLLPVIQAPHHVVFPPRLFLRGNHGSPINTRIFDTLASVPCAVAAFFAAGLFHRNS
jgi:hypothetical protein